MIKRNVTNNAVKTATTPSDAKPSGLGGLVGGAAGGVGGHIYSSSVSKGGSFANNVIGSVATGNITQMGTITGEKAVEALHSYMGHTALGPGAENIPTYQNVEIGGGRITGTEVTPEHPEGIPAAAEAWGLPVSGCTTSEPQRILDALAAGKLVVAIMSEGHFTSSGHFIVLRGVKDGQIMVADPASYKRSEQLWDLSIILNEASRRAGAGGPFWIIG